MILDIDLFKSIKIWELVYSFKKLYTKILESFDYYEYLNSISFHPPAMIITTLVFFYIRRKILLAGKKKLAIYLIFIFLNESKIK